MPADNSITLTGNIVFDPEPSDSNRPGKIRVASYCSGSDEKGNKKTAFVTVKSFDNDLLRTLRKGQKVTVTGRFDPWKPNESKYDVLDIMADDEGILAVEREGSNGSSRSSAQRRPAPATRSRDYDDEEPF